MRRPLTATRRGPYATRGFRASPSIRAAGEGFLDGGRRELFFGDQLQCADGCGEDDSRVLGKPGQSVFRIEDVVGEQEPQQIRRIAEQLQTLLDQGRGLAQQSLIRLAERHGHDAGEARYGTMRAAKSAGSSIRMWSPLIDSAFFWSKRAGFGFTSTMSNAAISSSSENTSRS